MTGDEMQSAIEFLLRNQVNFEVQLEKTNQQLERTDQQMELTDQRVSLLAETQTEFIQVMLQHVEAQGEINASMRRTMSELAQAQQQTQQEISDLTKIVGGLVKVVYKNGNPIQE
jgi:ABC-type Fe2+-enterobactin transport system substrate-binding protein